MWEKMIQRAILARNPDDPIDYVQKVVKPIAIAKAFSSLKECENKCNGCLSDRLQLRDNIYADIMVINESIDEYQKDQEVIYPLEGALGDNYFNKFLEHFKLSREDFFIVNLVNCFTHKSVNGEQIFRIPTKTEINNCKPYLKKIIRAIQPKLIILFGSSALHTFVNKSISEYHGKLFKIDGIPAIGTYHPSYFDRAANVRSESEIETLKDEFVEDLIKGLMHYGKENNKKTINIERG